MQNKRRRSGSGDWIDAWTDEYMGGTGIDKTKVKHDDFHANGALWIIQLQSHGWVAQNHAFALSPFYVFVCVTLCICVSVYECLPVAQLSVASLFDGAAAASTVWDSKVHYSSLSLGLIQRVDYHSEQYPCRRSQYQTSIPYTKSFTVSCNNLCWEHCSSLCGVNTFWIKKHFAPFRRKWRESRTVYVCVFVWLSACSGVRRLWVLGIHLPGL